MRREKSPRADECRRYLLWRGREMPCMASFPFPYRRADAYALSPFSINAPLGQYSGARHGTTSGTIFRAGRQEMGVEKAALRRERRLFKLRRHRSTAYAAYMSCRAWAY